MGMILAVLFGSALGVLLSELESVLFADRYLVFKLLVAISIWAVATALLIFAKLMVN